MHSIDVQSVNTNVGKIISTLLDVGCNVQFVQDKHQLNKDMAHREYTIRVGLPVGHNTIATSDAVPVVSLECVLMSNAILAAILEKLRKKASTASVIDRLTQAISQCNQ